MIEVTRQVDHTFQSTTLLRFLPEELIGSVGQIEDPFLVIAVNPDRDRRTGGGPVLLRRDFYADILFAPLASQLLAYLTNRRVGIVKCSLFNNRELRQNQTELMAKLGAIRGVELDPRQTHRCLDETSRPQIPGKFPHYPVCFLEPRTRSGIHRYIQDRCVLREKHQLQQWTLTKTRTDHALNDDSDGREEEEKGKQDHLATIALIPQEDAIVES